MTLLIVPLILIAAVLYVAYPLLQEEQQEELVPVPTDHDNAVAEKDGLIASLKDIEMDFQMGKLSQSDYEALKKEFELRAVAALKKLDRIGGGTARSKESES